MNLIVACDQEHHIGKDGQLLAHLPQDLKQFRQKTLGKILIMGRKTLESFPGAKPLAKRESWVLSRNRDYHPEGVRIFHSEEEIFLAIRQESIDERDIFIIGGGTIYDLFYPYCRKAYITHIQKVFEGADTSMIAIEEQEGWRLAEKSPILRDHDVSYYIATYENEQVKSFF